MEVYEPVDAPRLHPALSAADRMHLELNGYVVIPSVLSADETERLRTLAYDLEARVRSGGELPAPATLHSGSRLWFRVDNLPHLHPAWLDALMHPRLWGMAEEAIGGDARLEQSDITIMRPGPDGEQENFGLHCTPYPTLGGVEDGLYHYPFVKTLTLLTDVGPNDGGTVFVPGSHRLTGQAASHIARLAEADPRLVTQVTAPAGSTVLFFESTVHGSGTIRSGNDRVYLVGGYSAPMFQAWHEYDVDPEWAAGLDDTKRVFLTGSNRWLWRRRVRQLAEADVEGAEAACARTVQESARLRDKADVARAEQVALGKIR